MTGVISEEALYHSIHKLGQVRRDCTHQVRYANLLSQLIIGSQTVSLVITHDFNNKMLIQTRATIYHVDRCALNKDYCFDFTVRYYSREILCGQLVLFNGLNAAEWCYIASYLD